MPESFSWPLSPGTTDTTTPGAGQGTGAGATQTVATPRRNFRGLLQPFQRDGKSDLASVTGDDLLVSQVRAVLGNGEGFPWRHQQKSKLDRLRNQRNNPGLSAFARFYCAEALGQWLPSVVVLGVTATRTARTLDLLVSVARRDDLRPTPRSIDVPVSIPALAA